MSALGVEAVERAQNIALQADVVAAMTLEALQGTSRAFDEAIHLARPHRGQQAVAARLRKLLQCGGNMSEITGKYVFMQFASQLAPGLFDCQQAPTTQIKSGNLFNLAINSTLRARWSSSNAFVCEAGGLRFKSRASQFGHSVATARNRCNIVRKGLCCPDATTRRWAPQTRYTLQRNTASIMKDLI